jgi:antitoxin component of RelBE/YafQ-DinJ toxin-antitoxin module
MALSMVFNGADEETKEEMTKVLNSEGIDIAELIKQMLLVIQLHNDRRY